MANQSDNKNKYHTEILKATDSWTVLISDSINDNTLSIYTFQLFKYNIMYCKKNVWNNGCEWCWLFLGEIAHNGKRGGKKEKNLKVVTLNWNCQVSPGVRSTTVETSVLRLSVCDASCTKIFLNSIHCQLTYSLWVFHTHELLVNKKMFSKQWKKTLPPLVFICDPLH